MQAQYSHYPLRHLKLQMTEDKMSSFLNALLPDEEARKTPPLEPWFEGEQDP